MLSLTHLLSSYYNHQTNVLHSNVKSKFQLIEILTRGKFLKICIFFILKAKVYSCVHCSSVSIGCTLCWNGFKSVCPQCEIIVGYLPVKFEPVNKIIRESSLFRDSIERLHCAERLPAIIRLFEILEIEIMCDFCFHHLTEVKKGSSL